MRSLNQNTVSEPMEEGIHLVDPLAYYLKVHALKRAYDAGDLPRHEEKLLRLYNLYEGIASRKVLMPFSSDIEANLATLSMRYPHAQMAIEAVYDALLLGRLGSDYAQIGSSPLCLIGPPGSGKTTFAKALAHAIWTVPECIHRIDFPSLSAGFELVGSDSQWESGDAGRIAKFLALSRIANPLIIADEVDKSSFDSGRYSSPTTVLFHLLEKNTSRAFKDTGLDGLTIDCSHISWILTGNDLDRIPKPLRSRCNVVHIGYPKTTEERHLVVKSIWADLREEERWARSFEQALLDDVIELTATYQPREIRRLLEASAARCLARETQESMDRPDGTRLYRIEPWDVRKALQRSNLRHH